MSILDYLFKAMGAIYPYIIKLHSNISIGKNCYIDIQTKFILNNVNRGG
jgi:hypothetical protein